ncbi:MAG: AraC family transcriptional regulator, partial [Nocardiopsaceae bacterium]|nr:AraC family transcriptional regulator [Nocardiopsaceae bacterium]
MPTIVFMLAPQLHLLDLAGPAQVFSTAADDGYGYVLRYVAEQQDVPTAQGITMKAETSWPDLGPQDVILVPGWRASAHRDRQPLGEDSLRRLAAHHA